MPKTALIEVIIPAISAVDDPSSNHFVFHSDVVSDFTSIPDVFTPVHAFYNTAGTGGANALCKYMGNGLDRASNHSQINVYDITGHLDGSPHGAPVSHGTWTLGAANVAQSLPTGVAACISFRSDYGTDVEFAPGSRPRARDRNRIYVGPLNVSCIVDEAVTGRAQFTTQFITDALAALFDLSKSVDTGTNEWVLQQWSRKNAAIKLPTEGWMDNRPDYQRRRSDPGTLHTFRALASV